ncbi:fungal transcriptional regulatory protein [Colletotrichum asianum]
MAVTMADGPNRKACDRCHTQKLSCKRVGDEACERCVRLKTQCKSSPSLRYRKQHHQQSTGDILRRSIPSPKRQRSNSGSHVVQPDLSIVKTQAGDSITGNPGFGDHAVSPEAMLDIVDFDFAFGQPSLYPNPAPNQPLPPPFHGGMEDLMAGDSISHAWSPPQSATSESAFTSPVAPQPDPANHVYLGSPGPFRQSVRPGQQLDITPERRQRRRAKQRTRQISLRPAAGGPGPSAEEWMPRIINVNSRLFELSSSLPHQAEASDEPSRYSMASSPEEGSAMMTPFPVDEMFKLSRHFAEILAEMAPIEDASPASDMERHQPSKGLDSLADPATCLFILSTYVRLLDMYQKVFSCIHFQLGHLQPASLFQSWKLPGVTVGSFAVDSTPSLQMSLTIQLAEEFLLQMRRAASSLDPTLRSAESPAGRTLDATSMFSGVVDVSFQALKRQEESLGQELKDLRKDMESFLDG